MTRIHKTLILSCLLAALVLTTILAMTLFPLTARAGLKRSFPFQPGEKLVYDLYWTMVYAGQATLEVVDLEDHNGTLVYHFRATARSSEFLDSLYKVRDQMDSWTNLTVDRSFAYEQHQREGSYERDIWLDYHWPQGDALPGDPARITSQGAAGLLPLAGTAVSVPQGAGQGLADGAEDETLACAPLTPFVERFGHQGFKQRICLEGDTLDPLAVLYNFRSNYLHIGQTVQGWVSDGKKLAIGKGEVLARETVSVPAGEFDAFVVVPDTSEVGGVFKKSDGAKVWIWFSNDELRIPVKLKTQVAIGHVTAELVRIEPGR